MPGMPRMSYFLPILLHSLCYISAVLASVTVYNQEPLAKQTQAAATTATATGAAANYTGAAAYDPTVLAPPPLPNPLPPTAFTIPLQSSSAGVNGLSIPQAGTFFGFSIEMSVVTQVIGLNGSFIQPPFLNLMANLRDRVGAVHVRVGGNTQDYAVMVGSLADGKAIEKDKSSTTNPTQTPTLLFTSEILYLLANVSSLVGVKWYLGVPFNDTTNLRLEIAESGEQILGGNLLGLQVGNEPDLYARHGHRPTTYAPSDYFGEFGVVVQAINNDNSIPVKNNLIGPNLATGDWIPEQVWDTGFIPAYTNSLSALAVEHYPTDNCFAMYGVGSPIDLPTEFAAFMSHSMGINTISIYMNSSQVALAANKPFLMFETNTASCGGFPGISDSYGAALWGVDYALQMAYSNFSGALFHIGGQNVYYNPFTPPPTNQSTFRQWSIGPLYYSALVVAEAIGSTGKAQIVDLQPNANNQYTPAYAIYENGAAAKVVLLNYMTDPSGANDYTATIQVQGVSSVQVKYLSAPSVSTKANITWAGQTFGDKLSSDGRLQGTEDVQTVPCNNGACPIKVTAPGLALVFLSNTAYSDSAPSTTQTFATTAYTKTQHTATVAATVLATSNGHSGSSRQLGSTSKGSTGGAGVGKQISGLVALVAMVAGAWTVGKGLLA